VTTANDFGLNGDTPSHPELLDWLACRFVASGWDLKQLHRLILTSSVWQQSSAASETADGVERDPTNRLLWRFNRRRLTAEEIRDSLLCVSGELNPKLTGPSIMVPVDPELTELLYKPSQWEVSQDKSEHDRRSIYLIAKRNLRLPFMIAFDQPDLQTTCFRRQSSTHAPQALELLNGTLTNRLARNFASRLCNEAGSAPERIVDHAFVITTGELPTSQQRRAALEFLGSQPLEEFALAMFNLNAFLYVD
jgi:hypothetical protein